MAIQFSLSIFVVFTCLRWCSAEEQSVPKTMSQLRSILAFLPRPQKCDRLLFDLMKECVNEVTTTPAPTTTITPEVHEEIPVTLKTVSGPEAPTDDEDSNVEGSGFSYPNALPLNEYRGYRLSQSLYSTRTSGRKNNRKKSKKNKKNKRLSKFKKIHLTRKVKSPRKKEGKPKQVPTYSTLPEKKVLPPPKLKPEIKKPQETPPINTNWRGQSPEFFKYMGMG